MIRGLKNTRWYMPIWILIALLVLPAPARAQLSTSIVVGQTLNINPRSQALGEATVALRGYSGAEQLNPATIGRVNTIQLGSTIDGDIGFKTRWLPDVLNDLWIMNPSIDYKRNRWGIAYNYKRFFLGTHEKRDAQNNPIGTVTSFDASHKLATAFDVNPSLSVGAALNMISFARGGSVEGLQVDGRTFSVDLGLYYGRQIELPFVNLHTSAGWSLLDFGRRFRLETNFSGNVQREALPMMMRGGLGLVFELDKQIIGLPLLSVGLFGSLAKPLVYYDQEAFETVGPFQALFRDGWKSVQLRTNAFQDEEAVMISLSAWDQTRRHGGIELSLLKIIHLRWGRYREHELVGNRQYDAFGWGIDLYYVTLDVATNRNTTGAFDGMQYWKVTGRVPLGRTQDNFWSLLIDQLKK